MYYDGLWYRLSELNTLLMVVHMQQMFGTDDRYIEDEECGHERLFVPFGL